MFGFALRRVAVEGPGKPIAEVVLARGLNVIAGPSDTGKSFIVQCIDFALGGGKAPKVFPELDGYTTVLIDIESNQDNCLYTLERSLRGGETLCKSEGKPDVVLAAKHQGGREDTVSQFLLNLSGLGSKKVRMNMQGQTRPMSFRDLARLTIIDEETVIKENSPILTGQYATKTVESCVFRLLITGTDDSSIVAKENPKIESGRKAGKAELLEGLLKPIRERLAEFQPLGTLNEEREQLVHASVELQKAISSQFAAQASAAPLEMKRRNAWTKLRMVDSKVSVLTELQIRFGLLHDQYSSDLRRLEAIAEAGLRLDQLKEDRCPLCGALAEHHQHDQEATLLAPADVSKACAAEAAKTVKLLQDLQVTRKSTASEVALLSSEREERQHDLDSVSEELKTLLEQHVGNITKHVEQLRIVENGLRRKVELLERYQELDALLNEAKGSRKKENTEWTGGVVSTAQADPFSVEVETLLRAWHFPNPDRVSFSETEQDIVVSGRPRKGHGKGVRAITRAAFNLALLSLCVKDNRPYSNFVLIDSPLLVYEEPDAGESSFPQDVKRHFWNNVSASFTESQVIVVENSKQLPDGGVQGANLVLFTGNDQGRRGFIPVN